ncbi:DUF4097 family beta strand repeat-containing protein [Peptococcus simiae]|uniref:DUF4097 family beta strand repeat-containing protein n=1 Tax=Peptococcus simiae TaxID=1643805 RepID=UPI003980FF44
MDARARIILHKLRFVWIGLLVVALLALVAFIALNLSFNQSAGAFDKVKAPYQLEIPISSRDFDRLAIDAAGAKLELGMTSAIKKPTAYLYGESYTDEKVTADIKDGRVQVTCQSKEEGRTAKPLTLRILLPETDLRQVRISANQGGMTIDHLRTDDLAIQKGAGDIALKNINANSAKVESTDGPMRVEDNRISQFSLASDQGDLVLRNNKVQQLTVDNQTGDVFLYTPNFKGITDIQTFSGHITAISKRLPWSLLVEATADSQGDVQVNYAKRYWKKPDISEKSKQAWKGAVGDNPRNILRLKTEDGHITLDQRSRYTDTQSDRL